MYADLRKRLIRMFDNVFKKNLTPADRLDIPPIKIPIVLHHEDVTPYNSKIPIDTQTFLESAARKDLGRILRSGTFFVQKTWKPR